MSWGFVKRLRLSRFLTLNLSRRGGSVTARLGRVSTNSRTRKLRAGVKGLWVQTKGKVW